MIQTYMKSVWKLPHVEIPETSSLSLIAARHMRLTIWMMRPWNGCYSLRYLAFFLHPHRQRRCRLVAMTLEAFRLTNTDISEQSIRMQDGCMSAPPLRCLQHMLMWHLATFGPLNDRRAWFWCVTTTRAPIIPIIEYLGSGRVLQLFSSTPWHHVLRPFYQRPTSARDPPRWRCLARQETPRRTQISGVAIARSWERGNSSLRFPSSTFWSKSLQISGRSVALLLCWLERQM